MLLWVSLPLAPAADAAEDAAIDAAKDAAGVQAELAAVGQAIESIRAWMETAGAQRSEAELRLREAELAVAEMRTAVAEIRSAITGITLNLGSLEESISVLEGQRDSQQTLVASALYSAYVDGPQSQFKVLLNQQDPSLAPRMLVYHQRFNAVRLEQIRTFQQTLQSLSSGRQQLQAEQQRLNDRQEELAARQSELETSLAARQSALTELSAAMAARGQELEALLSDRQELEALLERIEEAVEQIPAIPDLPFVQRRGQLPWPAQGRFISEFGSPFGDGSLRRQGIIIAGSPGTPVRAVHGGRVVFADWLRGYGLLTILDHGDGYMSLYGYNQTLTTEPGAWVESGDIVAESGASGSQDTAGIYFEIRHNGRPENPLDWCISLSP
ncbi:MAG: hypothetical protein RLZZ385_2568 [Pseudomonadota bacterium]|jgi:septal ring factor EnvC (AmiA/AmiB activator)